MINLCIQIGKGLQIRIMSCLVKKTKIIFDSFLLVFKSKKINIVTVSSYATQLGFLTTYKYQNNIKKINSESESKIIFIFLFFPIRSDTKIKNICNFKEILGKQKYVNFKVDSLIRRLLIYPIFYLIYFTKNRDNIFLWQTRYRWINDLYQRTNCKSRSHRFRIISMDIFRFHYQYLKRQTTFDVLKVDQK